MVTLSCGCWYLTPEEIDRQAGYSDDPIVTSATCPRCMRLRGKNVAARIKADAGENLDFFADLPAAPG